jgi:DNA polymerase II
MQKHKAFIVYSTYRIDEPGENARIHIFGRLENDKSFEAVFDVKPYFFIKKVDKDDAKAIIEDSELNAEFEEVKLKNLYDEDVTKIITNIPKDVSELRKLLEKNNIPCYEADVRFTQRFLMDNNIKGSMIIEGKEQESNNVNTFFDNPVITTCEYKPKNLKILSIDIETCRNMKTLYAISLYSKDISVVLLNAKHDNLKNAETFSSERELLSRFKELIIKEDPDIITGWNVISFDFAFLKKHFERVKVPFNLGRLDEKCTLRIEESFLRDSSADFKGRLLIDGLRLAKVSFIKLDDYKLNTAAKTILGDEKLLTGEQKGEEIEELFLHDQQKLIDYNLKDSVLVYDILYKSGMIDLSLSRSLLTGMQLDKIQASIATFDSVYLPRLRDKGKVAFSLSFANQHDRVRGGFVLPSKPGIYDWVIVCDFKSLYPTLFRTFNIDPYSHFYDEKQIPKDLPKEKFIKAPNGAIYKNQEGILSNLLTDFFKVRARVKKEKNLMASFAIKTVMASFSGVLASQNCRFSTFKVGDTVTSFAQMIIKHTIKLIEDKGYNVIYGDTDSIFIDLHVKSYEEASEKGKEFEKYINGYFDKWVPENYARKSYLDLEFEKTYKRFFMPKNRGSEVGAKKRYAGLLVNKEKEEIKEKVDFIGLEFVRRDWTAVSKDFQLGLLDRVFHKKEVAKFVKEFVEDIKSGKYDKKLVYKKALRKNLDEYTKTTPPHVKAARKLDKLKSNIIEYYMTSDGPEPLEALKHSIDYDHYINKQIKPIADSVLVFFNQKFDDVIKGSTQKNLFGF